LSYKCRNFIGNTLCVHHFSFIYVDSKTTFQLYFQRKSTYLYTWNYFYENCKLNPLGTTSKRAPRISTLPTFPLRNCKRRPLAIAVDFGGEVWFSWLCWLWCYYNMPVSARLLSWFVLFLSSLYKKICFIQIPRWRHENTS